MAKLGMMAGAQDPADYADMEDAIKILTEAIQGDIAPMPMPEPDYVVDEFPMCTVCEAIDATWEDADFCGILTYSECVNSTSCLVADDFNCWNDEMGIDTTIPDTPEPVPSDDCHCFANGAENEDFCETGLMLWDIEACVADDRCHWGPAEIDTCAMMSTMFE